MGNVHVVVGGQYGSEAKGHFTAQLVKQLAPSRPVLCIRVGGPNAGHTVIGDDGIGWKLRCVPVAAVAHHDVMLAIAQGSEIDEGVLHAEIARLERHGINVWNRLVVDPQATLIDPEDLESEQLGTDQPGMVERIGSTGKGIGAARARRIMRTADTYGETATNSSVAAYARRHLQHGDVIIEGTQGYGLGLHAGFYPYCTSRDCTALDFLGEVGISPWDPVVTRVYPWVIFRPYPIRVAGNSGPMEHESSWAELGLAEEHTTVTNKVRRVGHWEQDLAHAAMEANGSPGRFILMMFDQVCSDILDGEDGGLTDRAAGLVQEYERQVEAVCWGVGTGPSTFHWRFPL